MIAASALPNKDLMLHGTARLHSTHLEPFFFGFPLAKIVDSARYLVLFLEPPRTRSQAI